MTVSQTNTMQQKPMITDIFVRGARKGFDIATKAMIPNLIMAFVLIKALNVTGLLDLIGRVCAPVMELFGLPGEAATILASAWLSIGGGVGVAAALYEIQAMSGQELAVIMPSIFIMGSQLQYMGRCLGVIGINDRMLYVLMTMPIVFAFITMAVMNVLIG